MIQFRLIKKSSLIWASSFGDSDLASLVKNTVFESCLLITDPPTEQQGLRLSAWLTQMMEKLSLVEVSLGFFILLFGQPVLNRPQISSAAPIKQRWMQFNLGAHSTETPFILTLIGILVISILHALCLNLNISLGVLDFVVDWRHSLENCFCKGSFYRDRSCFYS